jgi:hypothetical protein
MALLTDSDIISTADLQAIDPECVKVASSQNPPITLSGVPSIIHQTLAEACSDITARFQNFTGFLVSPGVNLAHMAAVSNVLSTSISRPRMRLNQVVATGPDPSRQDVKLWLGFSALRALYRAAYARFTKEQDRFARKMEFYELEESRLWTNIRSSGIPIVLVPLPCPGALREPNPGTWGAANLAHGGSSSADPGSIWYVAITWTGAPYISPTVTGNAESGPSASETVTVLAKEVITVSISTLNPPGVTPTNVGTADGLYTQIQATGWNVYVGASASLMYLQNAAPIAIGTTSYTLADMPVLSGPIMGSGQWADYNWAIQNVLQRG